MDIKISPSMLASNFARLEDELKKCSDIGAELIHIDVMDGHFVPNITIGAPVVKAMKKVCHVPFDVHLMISDPLKYAEDFVDAGADILVFHVEADSDIDETIDKILSLGCKAGLAIKPGTHASSVMPFIHKLSMVLVMTVEPGFGGQTFMFETMPKVAEIRKYCDSNNLDLDIQVDGGVTPETIITASEAGANVFVAGSAIFNSSDPKATINALKENAKSAKI